MQNERKYWFPAKRYGLGLGHSQFLARLASVGRLRWVASRWFIPFSAQRKARCLPCLCHRPLRPTCRNVLAERRTAALALGQRVDQPAYQMRALLRCMSPVLMLWTAPPVGT